MKVIKTIILIVCIASFLTGCKEEPYVITCSDGSVNYRQLNDDLNPVAYLKDFNPDDSITVDVIQTADELFSDLRISLLRTKIDFEKETLLVGMVRTHSLGEVVAQQVESNCAGNEIVLRTTIRVGGVPATGHVHVFAIVPKISDETKVRLIADKI